MLPEPDALAEKLAAFLGGAPDRALAERLLALVQAQLETARPALVRAEAENTPADHAATLRELARHG